MALCRILTLKCLTPVWETVMEINRYRSSTHFFRGIWCQIMIRSGSFSKSTLLSAGEGSTLYKIRIWLIYVCLSANLYLIWFMWQRWFKFVPVVLHGAHSCVFFPLTVWGCQTTTLLLRLKVAQSNMNKTFFKEICWWKPLNLSNLLSLGSWPICHLRHCPCTFTAFLLLLQCPFWSQHENH